MDFEKSTPNYSQNRSAKNSCMLMEVYARSAKSVDELPQSRNSETTALTIAVTRNSKVAFRFRPIHLHPSWSPLSAC